MNNTYNQQIDEEILEQDEVYQLRQDESWAIRDLGTAAWADEIVFRNEKKIAEIEQVYNQQLETMKAKLDKWKDEASKKYLNDIEFFKTHLHLFHMRTLEQEELDGIPEKKRSKTIKLPSRKLKCVKQQPEILINGKEASKAKNDPELLKFVKENNPEHIKEEVAWGDYKKTLKQQTSDDGKLFYVDEAGQKLDFVELIEREVKFDWEPIKD